MLASKVVPNAVTYTALIEASSFIGDMQRGFSVYQLMKAKDPTMPNLRTYATLLHTCAAAAGSGEALQRARGVMEDLVKQGLEPDRRVHHLFVKIAAQSLNTAWTIRGLQVMVTAGEVPSHKCCQILAELMANDFEFQCQIKTVINQWNGEDSTVCIQSADRLEQQWRKLDSSRTPAP